MARANGVIVIKTELNTQQFNKQLERLENQADRTSKKLERQTLDLDIQISNVDQAKKDLGEIQAEYEKAVKARNEFAEEISPKVKQYSRLKGMIDQGQPITNEEYQRYSYLASKMEEYDQKQGELNRAVDIYGEKYNKVIKKLDDAEAKYDKQKIRVEETRRELERINQETGEINRKLEKGQSIDIPATIGKIGEKTEGVIKKVGRWALAIFGIRGIYMAIRNAINVIAQDDQQLKADIDYIRTALAYSLEPIVRVIVDLIKQLFVYLGYIIQKWTGKNIFENANKALKKSVGTAKELRKQLAGFDELNILQETSSSSSAGANPSIDLSKINEDKPGWVKWIGDNGKLILSTLAGVVTALTLIKKGVKGIKSLGIGMAVSGIIYSIKSILEYINDPSWEKFGDILIGIGLTIAGLAIAFGAWPVALAGAILLMLGILAKFWNDIKKFIDNLLKKIYTAGDDIVKYFLDNFGLLGVLLGTAVGTATGVITEFIRLISDRITNFFTFVKDILDGIISLFRDGFAVGIKKIFRGIANAIIGVLNTIIDGINLLISPLRAIIMVAGNILGADWTMEDVRIPNIPKLARGGIVHNPGPGVMMGSYIAGEGSSPEAVLPLDDNTMDRLGESIARHMTINANIYNTMNGRVISRELKRINNESEFAYNG